MPRRWKSLQELWLESERRGKTHISKAIYNELYQYAVDKQFYPVENALYRYMTETHFNEATQKYEAPRYPELGHGSFRWWFSRLVSAGLIEIDWRTSRAVRCDNLKIVEREGVEAFE